MPQRRSAIYKGLMLALAPLACSAQGGAGLANPQAQPPASAEERIEKLKRTQEFMIKLHDLMHQIREAPNDAERERLKAEQLRLMQTHMLPNAGSSAMMPQ